MAKELERGEDLRYVPNTSWQLELTGARERDLKVRSITVLTFTLCAFQPHIHYIAPTFLEVLLLSSRVFAQRTHHHQSCDANDILEGGQRSWPECADVCMCFFCAGIRTVLLRQEDIYVRSVLQHKYCTSMRRLTVLLYFTCTNCAFSVTKNILFTCSRVYSLWM